MDQTSGSVAEVNARVVYWGIEGSGKSSNLRAVYAKLRSDHRSEVREVPSRFDPSVSYEILPIELGEIAGVRTQIQIVAPPGAPEHAPTRKQLMDQIDGVVLVLDSQRERIDDNVACFEELREVLSAYGQSIEEIPLVIQYNKRDLADPYAVEELHRKLEIRGAAVFESVATEGTGVLQTLSTISKKTIRALRDQAAGAQPNAAPVGDSKVVEQAPPAPLEDEVAPPTQPGTLSADEIEWSGDADAIDAGDDVAKPLLMEDAILAEGQHSEQSAIDQTAAEAEQLLDAPWDQVVEEFAPRREMLGNLSIVSVGTAERASDRTIRVPVVLGNTDGETSSMLLTISLEPLVDKN